MLLNVGGLAPTSFRWRMFLEKYALPDFGIGLLQKHKHNFGRGGWATDKHCRLKRQINSS
jgi:hypothetical protein